MNNKLSLNVIQVICTFYPIIQSINKMDFTSKDIAVISLFIAISAALGFMFIGIPNFELITCSVFLSGFMLGKMKGTIVGAVSFFLYSGLNPYGSGLAFPPLLITQVTIYAIIGLSGGIISKFINPKEMTFLKYAVLAACGLISTVVYQIATSVTYYLVAGFTNEQLIGVVISGIAFTIVHIISNTIIFSTILPRLAARLLSLNIFIQSTSESA